MAKFVLVHSNSYTAALAWSRQPGYQVVTQSRLAARALKVPYQSLYQLAIQSSERVGWAIASALTAQTLFRQVVQEIVHPVDVLGMARAWMPTVRSLLQAGPTLPTVVSSLSPQTAQLLEVARHYQTALRQQQLIDSGELYWRAIEAIAAPQKVLIYGYFQPRPDELAWINALAAEESVLVLPLQDSPLFADQQASLMDLVQRGWEVLTEPRPSQTVGEQLSQTFCAPSNLNSQIQCAQTDEIGAIQLGQNPRVLAAHAYSTFDAEMRGALAQVKSLLNSGVPARDIAIVSRDETAYGPRLIDIAWEYGVPLRALYSTPLLTTRLGAWLSLLIEVLETKFPFESTARLLSHPLVSNPDRNFWAVVRRQHPQGLKAWQEIAIAQLDLDLGFLTQVNQTRRRDTWVAWWQTVLSRFALRRRCARWARESVAFNILRDALVELSKPEAELLSWEEFRQQLRDLLESLAVPAQPGRGGVELHSPTSVAGARYAHIFVMGMAEGVLPAPIRNDPVLDFFERQNLRSQGLFLPTAAELARQEALGFYFLLQTVTESVTFSYPKLRDRQEQLPSPYLTQLGLVPTAPPLHPIASLEELRRVGLRHDQPSEDGVLPHVVRAWRVEQHRKSDEPPNEFDGMVAIPFDYASWPFSVSQLRNLGQCPFKWFADKLLKLGPPEEVEEDLSPRQIGQLYHQVLELVLTALQEKPTLDCANLNLLQEKFAIAEQNLLLTNLPAWELRREEHIRCLSLTLQSPDFLPEGTIPVSLEASFEGEWHGLKVRGRVDRIDRTDMGLVLIDYKTGKSRPAGIKDRNSKACIDLQLPLYQEVAGSALFLHEPAPKAYYYSIRGRQRIAISSRAPQHELPDALERCKSHLTAGHYPVQPDRDQVACTYCDFDALCRQHEA